jgi:hypothetical protein
MAKVRLLKKLKPRAFLRACGGVALSQKILQAIAVKIR